MNDEKGLNGYEPKSEKIKQRVNQSTDINNQFVKRTASDPNKTDYRHANMKQEFRRGAIDYAKHMRWMEQ